MEIKTNRKKWILTFGLFISSSTILIGGIIIKSQIYDKFKTKNNLKNENQYITININGAIKYPGEYCLKKNSTYNDIFRESILLSGADLDNINREDTLINKQNIYIPFVKNKKLRVSDVKSVETLINLGIKSNIAIKIFDYLKEKNILSWDEILKIPGVGEKTYLLLVEKIII